MSTAPNTRDQEAEVNTKARGGFARSSSAIGGLVGLGVALVLAACYSANDPEVQQSPPVIHSDPDAGEKVIHPTTGDAGMNCVEGKACTTKDPGDCGKGHIACSGDNPVCVANVTSQSCYSGPDGTRDVGTCKSGTQTCAGQLGTCEGEVLPTAEDCFNTVDDDCDGVVNNGCPDHFVVGTPRSLTPHGGMGGTPSSVVCPPNTFVTRTDYALDEADGFIGGLSITCSGAFLTTAGNQYSVTLKPVDPAPFAKAIGMNGMTMAQGIDCGEGLNVPGYILGYASQYIDGLGTGCETGMLTPDGKGGLTVSFIRNDMLAYYPLQQTTPFKDNCENNEVLVGYNVRVGFWMDQVQGICAPLTIANK
jgi:hypothetical protein